WALRKTTLVERLLLVLAGLFLVFPSLLEALMEAVIGRDIDYTATFGFAIGAAVLLRQRMTVATARLPARGPQEVEDDHHEMQRTCHLRARDGRGGDGRCGLRPGGQSRAQYRHRDRRHRRGLLPARRRHGERAVQIRAGGAGDRARDRRL